MCVCVSRARAIARVRARSDDARRRARRAALYDATVAQLLVTFLQGFNVTVIAYGQTGSGKTYTMGSECGIDSEETRGLIPRALQALFGTLSSPPAVDADESSAPAPKVLVSFLEIYGEEVRALGRAREREEGASGERCVCV